MGNDISNNKENGLVNIGNSCYMNSSLQCLGNCKQFVKTIKSILKQKELKYENEQEKTLLENLNRIFVYLNGDLNVNLVEPVKNELKSVLSIINKMTEKYKRKVKSDSPEFTIDLLTILIEMKTKDKQPIVPSIEELTKNDFVDESAYNNWSSFIKKTNSNFVDLFYGQTQTELKCVNPLCKAEPQIKTKLIYDQYLLCGVTIPKICSLTVYVVYNNKVQSFVVKIDGKVLMFYLKCCVSDEIKNKKIFKDEIQNDNYTMTVTTITQANKNHENVNINIETREEKYIFDVAQESSVKQIFVVYIHSNNEQQSTTSYKYLFISKNPKDINEIPHLYIIPNINIDINKYLQDNNLDNIINNAAKNDISKWLNNSNKLIHLTVNNNQIHVMNVNKNEDNCSEADEQISVEDCLKFYCDNQRNMTKCKECKSLNLGKVFLTKLPYYFMVYLKRFYQDGKKVKKNCANISFTDKIDLRPYTNFTDHFVVATEYELIAINQHITKYTGISEHYNAKIKKQDQNQDKWLLCDDLIVTDTEYDDNFEYPLILVYKRKKKQT